MNTPCTEAPLRSAGMIHIEANEHGTHASACNELGNLTVWCCRFHQLKPHFSNIVASDPDLFRFIDIQVIGIAFP
jgi:hypothetical protein